MADAPVLQPLGLRERKKAQTRRLLIDAAVELCLKQGYENTTVEQITHAVEVSPRTFSRYFASKEAVFIAVIDDLSAEVTDEILRQPTDLGPLESLRAAHVAVLTRVAERRPIAGLTAERIAMMLQIVSSCHTLRQAAVEYRSPVAMAVLAERMGVAPDDKRLELAVATFATVIVTACVDVAASDPEVSFGPDFVRERLEKAMADLASFVGELETS
ncbi:TetR family transcriptional regulator [Mycobacterium yunnanensis]|uniref:TetR family transcriptional regulator n=1 Tax=Mycobacterium yunnanensis TaxID=368477 RepID=A0A9X3C162_9MYCO|nr:TetR/AcrR family transcriptional regulator [Mycobacterium yunnanensis]MCV7420036.1 TetR family transcriptional regulator [Mycobacterium yunnanensis]